VVNNYILDLSSGLTLFFTLSGFLLYHPFATVVLWGQAPPSIAHYFQNRSRRLPLAYRTLRRQRLTYEGRMGFFLNLVAVLALTVALWALMCRLVEAPRRRWKFGSARLIKAPSAGQIRVAPRSRDRENLDLGSWRSQFALTDQI
jgi:peptidoglycan/LPS O-acetylase OafA/YrhL